MERRSHADDPPLRVLRAVSWTESGDPTVTAIPEPLFEGELFPPFSPPHIILLLLVFLTVYFYIHFRVFFFPFPSFLLPFFFSPSPFPPFLLCLFLFHI